MEEHERQVRQKYQQWQQLQEAKEREAAQEAAITRQRLENKPIIRQPQPISVDDKDETFSHIGLTGLDRLERTKVSTITFTGREEDWPEFKFKFLSQMTQLKLKQFLVSEDDEVVSHDRYNDAQQMIFSHLVTCCKGDALRRLRQVGEDHPRCATAAWKALSEKYAPKTQVRVALLTEKLLFKTYNKHEGGDVEKYLESIMDLKVQLEDIGASVPESIVLAAISRGLPAEYDNILDNIRNSDVQLNMTQVMNRIKLKAEDIKQRQTIRAATSKAKYEVTLYTKGHTTYTKEAIKCFKCNRTGHYSKDCRQPTKTDAAKTEEDKSSKHEDKPDKSYPHTRGRGRYRGRGGRGGPGRAPGKAHVVKEATSSDDSDGSSMTLGLDMTLLSRSSEDIWLVDTGATQHVTPYLEDFTEIDRTRTASLTTANKNANAEVQGMGNVLTIIRDDAGKEHKILIKDVWYAPDAPVRILSVIKMARKGYKIESDHEKTIIRRPDGATITGKVKDNSYTIKTNIIRAHASIASTKDKDDKPTTDKAADQQREVAENSLDLWHKRLGHLHKEAIMHMINHQV
jgi:hypothetical protein